MFPGLVIYIRKFFNFDYCSEKDMCHISPWLMFLHQRESWVPYSMVEIRLALVFFDFL